MNLFIQVTKKHDTASCAVKWRPHETRNLPAKMPAGCAEPRKGSKSNFFFFDHSMGSSLELSARPSCKIFKGGPEPLEKESHEFLGSKRDDRFFNPFFEMVPKTCQGSFFVPALT